MYKMYGLKGTHLADIINSKIGRVFFYLKTRLGQLPICDKVFETAFRSRHNSRIHLVYIHMYVNTATGGSSKISATTGVMLTQAIMHSRDGHHMIFRTM